MIKVTIKGRDELLIEGHSRTAPVGLDIVCAGVSAIAICVNGAIEDRHLDAEEEARDGYYRVKAEESAAEYIIKTAVSGLKRIAKMYPDAVKINDL